MANQKFVRRKENFICEKCGSHVVGNGYTDHCPHCLWGKHVDTFPGDRRATCQGMMEPKRIEFIGKIRRIEYQCTRCGYIFKVKLADGDNMEKAVEIAK